MRGAWKGVIELRDRQIQNFGDSRRRMSGNQILNIDFFRASQFSQMFDDEQILSSLSHLEKKQVYRQLTWLSIYASTPGGTKGCP